jgi:hypothetical protein
VLPSGERRVIRPFPPKLAPRAESRGFCHRSLEFLNPPPWRYPPVPCGVLRSNVLSPIKRIRHPERVRAASHLFAATHSLAQKKKSVIPSEARDPSSIPRSPLLPTNQQPVIPTRVARAFSFARSVRDGPRSEGSAVPSCLPPKQIRHSERSPRSEKSLFDLCILPGF